MGMVKLGEIVWFHSQWLSELSGGRKRRTEREGRLRYKVYYDF